MDVSMSLSRLKFLKRKDSLFVPSYFAENSATLIQLQTILALSAEDRSESQLSTLMSFTKHLKFFGEIRDGISEDAHYQCCRLLKYEHYPAGKVSTRQLVFHEGDEGSKFYIILSGSCGVITSAKTAQGKKKLQLLTILRQGDCFGELSLISNKPRAASVLCREECDFAVLVRDDYTSLLGAIQNRQILEKIELLRQHPVFGTWKKEAIEKLSYFFKVRSVREKHVLFLAGQPVNEVFLIKAGMFRLTKTEVGYGGGKLRYKPIRNTIEIAIIGPGEMLGAAQALEDNAFEFTCHCFSDYGEALLIPKVNFKAVLGAEGKTGALLIYEKEKKAKGEEVPRDPPKEGKSAIQPIREEIYQRLTAKPILRGDLPIIYLPRVRQSTPLAKSTSSPMLGDKEGIPEAEKRLLQLSMLGPGDDFGDQARTVIPITVKKKVVKQRFVPKRRMRDVFFYQTKPRFISEEVDVYRATSLPCIPQNITEVPGLE